MSIVLIILGSIMGLFIPGFLIVLLLVPKIGIWEKIVLSITLSLVVDVFIGIYLGYNQTVAAITGGVNTRNVWTWMIILVAILLMANIIKYRTQLKEFATKK